MGYIKNKHRGGFTLVELLVVVLLVVMMGSVMGGSYIRQHKKRQVDKVAQELLLATKYARVVAVERQKPCTLTLDPSGGRFYLAVEEAGTAGGDVEEVVLDNLYTQPTELPGQVEFLRILVQSRAAEEAQTIWFYPDGTADPAVVQLGTEKRPYTLFVSATTGKAKLQRGVIEDVQRDVIDLDLGR